MQDELLNHAQMNLCTPDGLAFHRREIFCDFQIASHLETPDHQCYHRNEELSAM